MALMDCYYGNLKTIIHRRFKGEALRELDDIIAAKIALENMIIIYRLKKYYPDMPREQMESYLLHLWRKLPEKFLDAALSAKTPEEYLRIMENSRYAAMLGSEDIQSIGFGSQTIRSILSRRYMRRTQQPATAFVCHMFLSEMEIDNIVRIVEAVRYGMEPGDIMRLLVIN